MISFNHTYTLTWSIKSESLGGGTCGWWLGDMNACSVSFKTIFLKYYFMLDKCVFAYAYEYEVYRVYLIHSLHIHKMHVNLVYAWLM